MLNRHGAVSVSSNSRVRYARNGYYDQPATSCKCVDKYSSVPFSSASSETCSLPLCSSLLGAIGFLHQKLNWWIDSSFIGERQTRHYLFVKCRRWIPEIRRLWRRVEADCEWGGPRAPSVRLLFRDPRTTPALLEFLEDTRVR